MLLATNLCIITHRCYDRFLTLVYPPYNFVFHAESNIEYNIIAKRLQILLITFLIRLNYYKIHCQHVSNLSSHSDSTDYVLPPTQNLVLFGLPPVQSIEHWLHEIQVSHTDGTNV